MKNLIKSASVYIFIAGMLFACYQGPETMDEASEVQSELAENKLAAEMSIEGMVCSKGCAKFIEDEVAKMEGIVSSKVDFENKQAIFEFDQSAMNAEEIRDYINSVRDGQYKAVIIDKSQKSESDTPEAEQLEEEPELSSVRQEINFSFPELFTFFLERI